MHYGFEKVEWGGPEWTMILVAITGGSAFPTDSPFNLNPEQTRRHSETLLDLDLWQQLVANTMEGTCGRVWK